MKIALRGGHTAKCTGASGFLDEYNTMQAFYKEVRNILTKYGHTVVDCNTNEADKKQDVVLGATKSNNASADLFISLHMNASDGKGHGTEAWIYGASSKSVPYAQRLVNNFSKFGFTNRGVKSNPSYWEMQYVKAPNIIFETCFCDNKEDTDIFKSIPMLNLAYAVCNAIDTAIPLEPPKPTTTAPTTKNGWRVCIGYCEDKTNADILLAKAKIKGFTDAYIVPYTK